MNNIKELHNRSMDLAESALLARSDGDNEKATKLFRESLQLEIQAIDVIEQLPYLEPSYSILHLSAATLALDCNDVSTAENMIYKALAKNPPEEIAGDLRVLLIKILSKKSEKVVNHNKMITAPTPIRIISRANLHQIMAYTRRGVVVPAWVNTNKGSNSRPLGLPHNISSPAVCVAAKTHRVLNSIDASIRHNNQPRSRTTRITRDIAHRKAFTCNQKRYKTMTTESEICAALSQSQPQEVAQDLKNILKHIYLNR